VASVEDALAGTRDIIAEWVNENQQTRSAMRDLFATKGDARLVRHEGYVPSEGRHRQGNRGTEIRRLLRLGRTRRQGAFPSDPRYAERSRRRHPAAANPRAPRPGAAHPRSPLRQGTVGVLDTGAGGRFRQLQEAAGAVDGDGDSRRDQAAGRHRGGESLCREPAPAPARGPAGPEERPGHRPRLSHGLQGGLPRSAGPVEAFRRHLPTPKRETGGGGCGQDSRPVRETRHRGHCHRQRHRRPRDRSG